MNDEPVAARRESDHIPAYEVARLYGQVTDVLKDERFTTIDDKTGYDDKGMKIEIPAVSLVGIDDGPIREAGFHAVSVARVPNFRQEGNFVDEETIISIEDIDTASNVQDAYLIRAEDGFPTLLHVRGEVVEPAVPMQELRIRQAIGALIKEMKLSTEE